MHLSRNPELYSRLIVTLFYSCVVLGGFFYHGEESFTFINLFLLCITFLLSNFRMGAVLQATIHNKSTLLPCKYCVWQHVEVTRQWPLARILLFLFWPVSCGRSEARAQTLPRSRWTLADLEADINFAWGPLHQKETGGQLGEQKCNISACGRPSHLPSPEALLCSADNHTSAALRPPLTYAHTHTWCILQPLLISLHMHHRDSLYRPY